MTIWYLARGAGLAALILLSAATAIGAGMSVARTSSRRVVANYLHRVTTSLGLGALVLHIVAILSDSYAHVGWVGAIVPFTSGYRPTWVGLGTLAIYTFVLVAALGVARARFAASVRGARVWRTLHCLAYAGWGMAMAHGFFSGTDSDRGWVRVLYVVCGLAVVVAVSARLRGLAPRTAASVPGASRPAAAPSASRPGEWRDPQRVARNIAPLGSDRATRQEEGVGVR